MLGRESNGWDQVSKLDDSELQVDEEVISPDRHYLLFKVHWADGADAGQSFHLYCNRFLPDCRSLNVGSYYIETLATDASVEDIPKAKAAALKAIELDPTLSRPHVNLGGMKMAHEWDFASGEAEFKKALELDSNDSHAHQRYADNLGVLGGREQEALAEINRAHQLDPLSLAISVDVGIRCISPWALSRRSFTSASSS